jgi:hypothetical protein
MTTAWFQEVLNLKLSLSYAQLLLMMAEIDGVDILKSLSIAQ